MPPIKSKLANANFAVKSHKDSERLVEGFGFPTIRQEEGE
jgi:hypothetical protein